jgi:hypothetical protein
MEAMMANATTVQLTRASADDVRRILGNVDTAKLLEIMGLRPTVLDLEQASMWLAGDTDVFAGQPLPPTAGSLVAILTADDEDEAQ